MEYANAYVYKNQVVLDSLGLPDELLSQPNDSVPRAKYSGMGHCTLYICMTGRGGSSEET